MFTGKSESKGKKIRPIFRSAVTSTDLKRSFFDNNMCALNFLSPQKKLKRPVNTNIVTQVNKVRRNAGPSTNSTDNVQALLFGDMQNQPEANEWVQRREGKENLNAYISLEYDGDVFLPSGIYLTFHRISKR